MRAVHSGFWIVAALLMVMFIAPMAKGGDLPSDLCSLLPTATVNKVRNGTFTGPEKKVAPRPFRNTNEGTDCIYRNGGDVLLFRIYIDPSPESAKDLFARLKQYFGAGSTDVSGMGDEAYIDANHGLHVRKGKVRFFIDGVRNDQQRKTLGDGIIAQLYRVAEFDLWRSERLGECFGKTGQDDEKPELDEADRACGLGAQQCCART